MLNVLYASYSTIWHRMPIVADYFPVSVCGPAVCRLRRLVRPSHLASAWEKCKVDAAATRVGVEAGRQVSITWRSTAIQTVVVARAADGHEGIRASTQIAFPLARSQRPS
jgi:hypothetical protein